MKSHETVGTTELHCSSKLCTGLFQLTVRQIQTSLTDSTDLDFSHIVYIPATKEPVAAAIINTGVVNEFRRILIRHAMYS